MKFRLAAPLDGFHTHVPLKVLDAMDFDVWDLNFSVELFRNDEIKYYASVEQVKSFRRL